MYSSGLYRSKTSPSSSSSSSSNLRPLPKSTPEREALIDLHDLQIVKERLLFAEDVGMDLETKRSLSRILQAQEYHRTAKDALHPFRAELTQLSRTELRHRRLQHPFSAVSPTEDAHSPAYYDPISPASSNQGTESGAEIGRRSPSSSVSSFQSITAIPDFDFNQLHVEFPIPIHSESASQMKAQSSPFLTKPDLNQPGGYQPVIHAPGGDGVSPRLHVVPATPVSGGDDTTQAAGLRNSVSRGKTNTSNVPLSDWTHHLSNPPANSTPQPAFEFRTGAGSASAHGQSNGTVTEHPATVRGDDYLLSPSPSHSRSKYGTSICPPQWYLNPSHPSASAHSLPFNIPAHGQPNGTTTEHPATVQGDNDLLPPSPSRTRSKSGTSVFPPQWDPSPSNEPPLSSQHFEPGPSNVGSGRTVGTNEVHPPDKLHPTLSCWIKNMNKLSSLIDRLEKLASSAPAGRQSQLLEQVKAFRATSKEQKKRFMEFLTLSEEYANKYLLNISDDIQQQSSFLDKLKGRLEDAEKLRGEAVELKQFYESGTVAAMQNFRATEISRPLPEDVDLFKKVDEVLIEIRHCYMELDKFWTEEVSRAIEALKMRRVDPADLECWRNFHPNLKQITESWENELSSGVAQPLHRQNACSSKEADIGAIASSLPPAMRSLTLALDRLLLSNSMKYLQSGRSSIQPVYEAFAANIDLCLSFLRHCADYGEKVVGLPSIASPSSLRVSPSHDLRERTMKLRSEAIRVSAGNDASVQGPREFKAAYNKALSLERRMTSESNILLGKLSSWVMVTDADGNDHLDDAIITLGQLSELWEKARDSVSLALASLRNEPAPRLVCHSSLASTRFRSVVKRWMTLVRSL